MGVSLLTILVISITTTLHCCHVLSPRLSLLFNIPLLIFWLLSFSLLTWNMSGTLTHVCNRSNWGNGDGVMICRIYKTLFSFTCVGTTSAILAVILDIKTRRKQVRLGNYAAMGNSRAGSRMSEKIPEIHVEPLRGESPPAAVRENSPYGQTHSPSHGYHDSVSSNRGRDDGYEAYDSRAPHVEYNGAPVGQYGNNKWGNQQPMRAEDFGYAAPSEQTRYDGPGAYGAR
jgi:hypothetical protein